MLLAQVAQQVQLVGEGTPSGHPWVEQEPDARLSGPSGRSTRPDPLRRRTNQVSGSTWRTEMSRPAGVR